jgi:hypothetical protein
VRFCWRQSASALWAFAFSPGGVIWYEIQGVRIEPLDGLTPFGLAACWLGWLLACKKLHNHLPVTRQPAGFFHPWFFLPVV